MTASLDRDWDNRWAGYGLDDEPPPAGANGNQPDVAADPDDTSWADRLEAALLDTAGLDTIGDPIPLIRDVLQTDSLAWLAGRPGHAKTLIALDLAGCVGTGQHWQGFPVQQGQVLYLIAEGVRGIRQRVRAWETSMGQPMSGVTFLPVAVQSANTTQWKALCELAAKRRPALIVVDTQARVTVGMEENSSKDMGVFVDQLERLRRYSGACILTLHHTPRNSDNLRGSTAMEGAATTIIKAVKEGDTVTCTTTRRRAASRRIGSRSTRSTCVWFRPTRP
jgi:RecA-family ATPase